MEKSIVVELLDAAAYEFSKGETIGHGFTGPFPYAAGPPGAPPGEVAAGGP